MPFMCTDCPIPRHLTPITIVSIICTFKIIYLTVRWLVMGINVYKIDREVFVSTEILFGFLKKLLSWKSWLYNSIIIEIELELLVA